MSRIVAAYQEEGTTLATIGPVRYMSPESLKHRKYSTASDVWSFACLCVEVISGRPPHADLDLLDAGVRIRDEGLSPDIPSGMPAWLANICKRSWQRNPADRPTMSDFVSAFKPNIGPTSVSSLGYSSIAATPGSSASILLTSTDEKSQQKPTSTS